LRRDINTCKISDQLFTKII